MTLTPRAYITCLVLMAPGISAWADERLAGIACRSVHLQYPAPAGDAFANEVVVDQSSEGTYFCVCGFNQGYFGLQELTGGKKVLIFSVWDPGKQDDPNAVAENQRVKLVAKDEHVRIGRFGNEGTGGQSFLDFDWKPGETYRFLVTSRVEGERTAFAAYFGPPGAKTWRHLATFSTLTGGKPLGGYYSFIEDFRRNRASATRERRARFGNGWVRGTDGHWAALTRARFTADGNPALNIDAGARDDRFFLATGGEVTNVGTRLGQEIDHLPRGVLAPP
ncbi:MAG: DUF3472 domain-containing protein [Isosphaeraceae bacterium]|nr:DUF3472 domain-containing protein [Isosphaeraceae bacterium]